MTKYRLLRKSLRNLVKSLGNMQGSSLCSAPPIQEVLGLYSRTVFGHLASVWSYYFKTSAQIFSWKKSRLFLSFVS